MSDNTDARGSGGEQQSNQSDKTEQTMSNSQEQAKSSIGLPSPDEVPDRCTEFQVKHPLDDPEDADFAYICPRCEKPNALCGKPTEFANKPFRCLKDGCGYVALLDPDALEEFEKEADL